MASVTLSWILAAAAFQVCNPGDDPPENPEEAAAASECACGIRGGAGGGPPSQLEASRLREKVSSSCRPASRRHSATAPDILP